RTISMALNLV
uniref:Uncharacterized protein n=1 Tax=Amphimedon queenslandica TaxID=400682 RepID=A0A1X7V5Q7_AMPQE